MNKVISREYVKMNYIHKDVLEKFIEDNIFYAGYDIKDEYLKGKRDENDKIMNGLEKLLEEKEDENTSN